MGYIYNIPNKIPISFINEMNSVKKYWIKFNKNDIFTLFEFHDDELWSSKLNISTILKEINNLINKNNKLNDDEFIALCWLIHYESRHDIIVSIKRIGRRGNTNRFIKK